jgi:broad specificity phosphatase PhoE
VTLGHRVMMTVAIVIAILIALALYGYLTGSWEVEAQTQRERVPLPPLPLSKYEKRLLEIDRAAVDQAYHDQILHLFQTWMKDESEQPLRAAKGARQARSAYERAVGAIEERDRLLREKAP